MWQRNLLTKPGLTLFDLRIAKKVASDGISSRDTQNEGQTPTETHGKLCGRGKAYPLASCAFSVQREERKRKGVVRPRMPGSSDV